MKTKAYLRRLWIGLLPVLLVGCAASRTARTVVVSPVETLTPDGNSTVRVHALIDIPDRALSCRSRLIIRPQLMQGDRLVAYCPVAVFDAPVYARKRQREEVLSGRVDTLADRAVVVRFRRAFSVPYEATVPVPESFTGGRIVAVVTANGCGESRTLARPDMALIANLPTLIDPQRDLLLNWIEPEFVIRPKVVQGRGEARLQFAINRYDINLALGDNRREMDAMLGTLQRIVSDSLMTLNSLAIYGMASADGPYAFNTALARNRANSARVWLARRLDFSAARTRAIATGSRPEGWLPVLEAMRADGHPDTAEVAAILDRYGAENDDAAEYRIRRLACWSDIRAKYLQKDRKVEYEYTYTIRSFTTDEELLAMYATRPDAFNEEELLRVATLRHTPQEKQEACRTVLRYFPQSQVAASNLAVLLLREGRLDEAEAVLDRFEDLSPEMLNTKAAIRIVRNDYAGAVELLEAAGELPEARYNLGLLMARTGELDRACELLRGRDDANAAIVALSVGRTAEAAAKMTACGDRSPRAEYVRALIAARQGDVEALMAHLAGAVVEESLRQRAAVEADFVPYASRADFKALIGRGREHE